MPRKSAPKTQFNVSLPTEVVQFVEHQWRRTGMSRSIRALAGLCAFECCDATLRANMIEWATRLSEGTVSWEDLLEHIQRAKEAALDQKKLQDSLRDLTEPGKGRRRA